MNITLQEIIDQMRAAHARMGAKNPNKRLLRIAVQVMTQMADQIVELRKL